MLLQKLRRTNCLEAISEALSRPSITPYDLNVISMRHCLYKCKSTNQIWSPSIEAPYHTEGEAARLLSLYQVLYHTIHRKGRPLKLLYQQLSTETILGWVCFYLLFICMNLDIKVIANKNSIYLNCRLLFVIYDVIFIP